ncbi:MAG: homocysteine biosynthesis protein [Synechococcales cyanobacterium]
MANRTIAEINERIATGTARVLTLTELKQSLPRDPSDALCQEWFEQVDILTSGLFEPMEACGAVINLGHTDPPIKLKQVWLNEVMAYAGLGAVDLYVGASQVSEASEASYGGAHVIADLVAGKPVHLRATGYGTDCYPRREWETTIHKDRVNQFYLFNPRGLYQNFIVGVNGGDRPLYTYLGLLQPHLGNAVYAHPGSLSPLLNDPLLNTIGIGTRIWLGGGTGYIAWEGTQHFPTQKRQSNQTPIGPAATVALIGDAKTMSPEWVRGCFFRHYGSALMVGVGIPIAVLSPAVIRGATLRDEDLVAPVIDFAIPRRIRPSYGLVTYAQLKSGQIRLNHQDV